MRNGKGYFKKADGTKIKIGDNTMMSGGEPDESYRWLVEDVPLRIYYKEAARFAYKSLELELQSSDEFEHIDFDMFRGLPDIRLFHGLGGDKNSDDWDMDERISDDWDMDE